MSFYQNERAIPLDFVHYACIFSDVLMARELLGGKPWTFTEATEAWLASRDAGWLSGDLNHDGDYDDTGEDEIQDYDSIFKTYEIPLKTIDTSRLGLPFVKTIDGTLRLAPLRQPLDPAKYWTIEDWRWTILHHVVGDGTGRLKPRYDSISGGSRTRAKGHIESVHVFGITI